MAPPLFSKILLNPSSPELQIPSSFATKYFNNEIPNDPITLSANGGYSWEIRVEKVDESYRFTNGWESVVRDAQFCFADMVLFRVVGRSSFKMSIYSSNGLERSLPLKSGRDVDPDVVVVDADDDEVVDVDDDDDDDGDDDDQVIVSLSDDEDDDGGDPFFRSVISKSHSIMLRLPRDFVRLAKLEARRTIILKNPEGKEWLMGVGLDRGNVTERYYLSGWLDFRRSNKLSEGDECVFKFRRSENTICLEKVTRRGGGVMKQQGECSEVAKKPRGRPRKCVEVAKRPRGRPRKQR